MYSCAYCEYSTSYLQNLKRHEKNKHDKSKHALSQTGSGADVPMEQTAPSHFHNEKHSNLQEDRGEYITLFPKKHLGKVSYFSEIREKFLDFWIPPLCRE